MKTLITYAGAVALLLAIGCSRQEPAQSAGPAPSQEEIAAKIVAEVKAKTNVAPAAPAPAAAVTESAPAAPAQPAPSAAPVESVTSKSQTLIDAATKLISEKKWDEALKTLTELTSLKLTPEQQKTVDALKQQAQALAQSAATDKAAKSVTDLLKKP